MKVNTAAPSRITVPATRARALMPPSSSAPVSARPPEVVLPVAVVVEDPEPPGWAVVSSSSETPLLAALQGTLIGVEPGAIVTSIVSWSGLSVTLPLFPGL